MRFLGFLVVLAGCGFSAGGGGQPAVDDQPGDDQPAPPDVVVIDAMIDTPPIDACIDTDNDGVCDAMDICAGGDDNLDTDHDTVPDHCDDWPCGPTPVAPSSPVAWNNADGTKTERTQVSNTRLGGGNANLFVVAPNANVMLTADYSIYDCICPGCIDQVQIGFATNANYTEAPKCLFSGTLNGTCMTPKTGTTTVLIKAPGTVGTVYDVVFGRAQANGCGGGWWPGMPAANTTVAKVCVWN